MIPAVNQLLSNSLELVVQPGQTYQMDHKTKTINGIVDGLEAVKQTVYMILNTERYQYIIYSWNYGVELADLFGQPTSYVCPELERRITEALIQDDRIESVDSFEFVVSKGKVTVSFVVHTNLGDIPMEKAVMI
ncbi:MULTISPECIES: DUF2634 domain-containing protein [Clostridiaceae]|uniref:DUF2634 domain-containing protein n=1 Tax=Clostridium facile TaxID=2763035 RepID=A0ABR7INM9_9CLOT|nr:MULTISPECIES: DUF2634 domain-containing protein [Clostridiaceae]MBC5786736.1 DUF2634 domain-containing protein [Clostridium facile]PWM99541.1 MAG: DUF2634 domain-containing protein [Massilioclostridium sp.]